MSECEYSVAANIVLTQALLDNHLLNYHLGAQLNKIFWLNENGGTIHEIATAVWICTDRDEYEGEVEVTIEEIEAVLNELKERYTKG